MPLTYQIVFLADILQLSSEIAEFPCSVISIFYTDP